MIVRKVETACVSLESIKPSLIRQDTTSLGESSCRQGPGSAIDKSPAGRPKASAPSTKPNVVLTEPKKIMPQVLGTENIVFGKRGLDRSNPCEFIEFGRTLAQSQDYPSMSKTIRLKLGLIQSLPKPLRKKILCESLFSGQAVAKSHRYLSHVKKVHHAAERLFFLNEDLRGFISYLKTEQGSCQWLGRGVQLMGVNEIMSEVLKNNSLAFHAEVFRPRSKNTFFPRCSQLQVASAVSILAEFNAKEAQFMLEGYSEEKNQRSLSLLESLALARQRVLDLIFVESELSFLASQDKQAPDMVGAFLADQRSNAHFLEEAVFHLKNLELECGVPKAKCSPQLRKSVFHTF